MSLPDLSHLAIPGATVTVRVTPKASANGIVLRDGQIRMNVTVVPEGGKANSAVQKLLAKAMGVPKSRLELIRGATARDKVFSVS
ncbi:DUF167 domain-containing protein [Roseovarius indicus]|uniref:UPF0235 protein RIdsm_03829 n=1 Tax=Roseovarius indicus TaxID=540747 RepID=A0A0T5P410_9RHOB|nr:DUF167 domain-containing protein [Roseovarius indicus]KRS16002.1 hypothetical protein XM52_20790 [Roseovarius indicus]QEW28004.1 hypothetical protein RIdsm_03829 [Roseovarius indicus]SFE59598.1 hypothetical protein SAMN04488031_11378 [Roseovarius indicus]